MKYRADHALGQIEVLMSVAVQKMVNAQTEPRRVCRRLICLSYAAMSDLSRAA
jgi:hypothetical protein